MGAESYNLRIEQGATFQLQITWTDDNGSPVILTSYSARMELRLSRDFAEALLSLSDDPDVGGITLGGALGTIDILIPAAMTATLNFDMAVYDLQLISGGGEVTRLLEGTVTLSRRVSL